MLDDDAMELRRRLGALDLKGKLDGEVIFYPSDRLYIVNLLCGIVFMAFYSVLVTRSHVVSFVLVGKFEMSDMFSILFLSNKFVFRGAYEEVTDWR